MIESIVNFMATDWFRLVLFVFTSLIIGFVISGKISIKLAGYLLCFIVPSAFINYFLANPLSPSQTVLLLFALVFVVSIIDSSSDFKQHK